MNVLLRERPRPDRIRNLPSAWRLAVLTVCFGAFMGQLDASITTLAYPALRTGFHASLAAVSWVSLSYLLTLTVLLVPTGRLSDAFGRKLFYVYGFGVFTAASAACALAPSLDTLIAFRVVQALGAAMLQANSIALISNAAPREKLRQALGIQAAAQALGLGLGPAVGGLLVDTLGWRWVFGVNVPVGVVALVGGVFLLPRTRERNPGLRPDLAPAEAARRALGPARRGRRLPGPVRAAGPGAGDHGGARQQRAGLRAGADHAAGRLRGRRVVPEVPRGRRAGSGRRRAGRAAGAALRARWCWFRCSASWGLGLGAYAPANNAQVMAAVPQKASGVVSGLLNTARSLGTSGGVYVVTSAIALANHSSGRGSRYAFAGLLLVCLLTLAVCGTSEPAPGPGRTRRRAASPTRAADRAACAG